VQHGAQSFGPLRPGGQAEVEPGAGDGLLGPADPLRHRRLRDPERRGDLRRGQAADGAQRQRDLAGRGQVRMAAAEQQGQRVVPVGVLGVGRGTEQFGRRGGHRGLFLAGPSRLLAAYLVRQPPRRDRDQPSARVVGESARRPLLRGREQGFLAGVLA
jgi:hypothetical protein